MLHTELKIANPNGGNEMKNLFTQSVIATTLIIMCLLGMANAMQRPITGKKAKIEIVIIEVASKEDLQKITDKINHDIEHGYPIRILSPKATSEWCKKMEEWCEENQIKTNIEKKEIRENACVRFCKKNAGKFFCCLECISFICALFASCLSVAAVIGGGIELELNSLCNKTLPQQNITECESTRNHKILIGTVILSSGFVFFIIMFCCGFLARFFDYMRNHFETPLIFFRRGTPRFKVILDPKNHSQQTLQEKLLNILSEEKITDVDLLFNQ